MELPEQLAKYPFAKFRRRCPRPDSDSSSTSGVSDLEGDRISLTSDTSAASIIKGHIGETPSLSATDENLFEALLHVDYLIKSLEKMDQEHPPGSLKAPSKIIQKLSQAKELIQKAREQEVKVETRLKYQRLYSKAERQQAEIEWKIRDIEDSQKRTRSQDEHMEGVRLLLLQEYLDKVEERNTIISLMDHLENMDDDKLTGTANDDLDEMKRSVRG